MGKPVNYKDLLETIYGVKVKDYTPAPEELARTHQYLVELQSGQRTLKLNDQKEPQEKP